MDLPNDSRASAFNEDEFRDAIRFAMNMGLPDNDSMRPTFRWKVDRTNAIADPAGDPYVWSEVPTAIVTHDDVQVPVAVEFTARKSAAEGGPFGEIDVSRVTLTLLDEDFDQIAGADQVILTGNTYDIAMVAPAQGLFGVTVWTVYGNAVDES